MSASTKNSPPWLNDFPLPAILTEGEHFQVVAHNDAFLSELQCLDPIEPNSALTDYLRPKNSNQSLSQADAGQWHSGLWKTERSVVPAVVVFQPLPTCKPIATNQTLFVVIANEHLVHAVTHPAIEQIAQRHRDFVSVVSHEFRTPLTSIKGYADTLLRYSTNLTDEQQTKFVSTIKEQADRLTRMVENLLTVSKLGEETIQLDFRSVPTHKLIQNVSSNILAKGSQDKLYANRDIDCQIGDTLPPLWGDPDKIEQVITNLVDNAVKYAFENTTIVITTTEADNAQLTMSITNKGAGIPNDQVHSIFKRFSRADDPLTRQVEGTGLGLYITKSLVEAMNGHITVDSVQQEETTFHLTLPIATDERQAAYNKSRGVDDAWILENGE